MSTYYIIAARQRSGSTVLASLVQALTDAPQCDDPRPERPDTPDGTFASTSLEHALAWFHTGSVADRAEGKRRLSAWLNAQQGDQVIMKSHLLIPVLEDLVQELKRRGHSAYVLTTSRSLEASARSLARLHGENDSDEAILQEMHKRVKRQQDQLDDAFRRSEPDLTVRFDDLFEDPKLDNVIKALKGVLGQRDESHAKNRVRKDLKHF